MDWLPEIKKLFDGMVEKIPEVVRPVVKPALVEAAEKKCAERGGNAVAEVDFVVGMFEVTPPAFQPTMIGDLESFGIPYDKYLAKVDSDFKCNTDLDQLVKDMVKLGEITGVKINPDAIWRPLKAYSQFYIGSPVSIRTTNKPIEKRDVSVRYVELMHPHEPDPYTTAINQGLILIECPDAVNAYSDKSEVKLDVDLGKISVDGREFCFPRLPKEIIAIRDAGGLLNYTREKLKTKK